MKMVIRADDVGYTHVHNLGTFEAVDSGLVTSCDVMLDTPGTVEALELLHERPWISTGWHTHFWGSPVLDPSKVPSMVDKETGHFRRDLSRAEDVSYEECMAEMQAQMERCIQVLGRVPDTAMAGGGATAFAQALSDTAKKYGLVSNFAYHVDFRSLFEKHEFVIADPAETWKPRKIYMTIEMEGTPTQAVFRTDSIAVQKEYDPLRLWTADDAGLSTLPADATAVVVLHPGYLDDYVLKDGDHSPQSWQYLLTRPMEVRALCSPILRNWMLEHQIELVNFRDALFGTQEYQNHLCAVGSELCML